MEEKTDVNSRDSHGWAALHLAAARGHEPVAWLAEGGRERVNGIGRLVLHLAASKVHEALARLMLMQRKADVNIRHGIGRTVLLWRRIKARSGSGATGGRGEVGPPRKGQGRMDSAARWGGDITSNGREGGPQCLRPVGKKTLRRAVEPLGIQWIEKAKEWYLSENHKASQKR